MAAKLSPSFKVWDAVAVSGTDTYKSASSNIQGARLVSYIVAFTGTMTGTLTVEVSNSSQDQVNAGTDTWTTYSGISIPAITTATTFGIELVDLAFGRVRLSYTNATNSGTVTATVTVKG